MTEPLRISNTEIRTIYDLLDLVRVRSGMWIGEPSITRLHLFLEGFRCGVEAAHASLQQGQPDFQGFHAWVAARLGRNLNGHGWCSMLLEACADDEEAALARFWLELDAFRVQSARGDGTTTG